MSKQGKAAKNVSSAEKNKSLQTENENLKLELKQLKESLETTESDFNRSVRKRERLDCLAKALENRTQEIKAENRAHILAAEDQGQNLADEVSSNMGVMKNIHVNLGQVTKESSNVREENDNLLKKVDELKVVYGDREKTIQAELDEAHNAFIKAQTDFAHLKLKTAEDKEKLFGEMQRVASELVESKQQMKDAKETELGLRTLLQKYDEKFKGLNEALMETNKGYDSFKDEMEGMVKRTKDLEQEALKWQKRWEESNTTLLGMSKDHEKLQNELQVVHDKLVKMTGLCRTLQQEIAALEEEKKKTPASQAPAAAVAPAALPQNDNKPNPPAEAKPTTATPAPAPTSNTKPAPAPTPLPANPKSSPAKPAAAAPAQNTKGGKGKNKQQNQKQPEKPKTPEPPKPAAEKPKEEPKPVAVKAAEAPAPPPPKEEPKPQEQQPEKLIEAAQQVKSTQPSATPPPTNAQISSATAAVEAPKVPEALQAPSEPPKATTPDPNQSSSQQKKKKNKRGKH